MPDESRRRWISWAFLALAILVVSFFLPIANWLVDLRSWISSLGVWGPVAFVAIYALACLLLLPGAAMTPVAGFLFGLGWGTLWTVAASNICANAAFLIGRHWARDAVARKVGENESFEAIDEAVGREGWKIVGLTRLSPVFPFSLLNYAFGLTKVKWSHYASASFLGMIPGTLLYVYLGSLGKIALESGETATARYVFYGVGFAATVAVTFYVTKLAREALRERLP